MARKFFVGGNWKNNGTVKSIETLVAGLNDGQADTSTVAVSGVAPYLNRSPIEQKCLSLGYDVVVAPTALHIPFVQSKLRDDFKVAAQNAWVKGPGAYTGEISPDILVDLGLKWVILGHSERRALIKESSEFVAEKTAYALDKGLSVILCVGESLEEREAGDTFKVVVEQLSPVAAKVQGEWSHIVIAYEPVWAIGTGKVATPQQAEEVHAQIRGWLADSVSKDVAEATRIIYGGSVSAKNCVELAGCPNIDGFLVGGASLKPEFIDIINSNGKK